MNTLTPQSTNAVFSLFDNLTSLAFWIRSADYQKQLYVSKAYEAIWKRPVESLYEHPESFIETLSQDDNRIIDAFAQRQSKGFHSTLLFKVRRPDSSTRWVKDTSCPLLDKHGQRIAVVGIGECIPDAELDTLLLNNQAMTKNPAIFKDFLSILFQEYALQHEQPVLNGSLGAPKSEVGCFIEVDSQLIWVSPRELQVLNYLMTGHSAKQTAAHLDISTRTVETYLDNVRKKTQCRTKMALLGKLKLPTAF